MRNLTLLTDLYQLTMANAYYLKGMHSRRAVFDLYFRRNGKINYAVAAGLEQACEYVQDFHFSEEDLEYLKKLKLFDDGFLKYLGELKFTGDLWSAEEGTVIFPDEPILIVDAPILQAQLLETALLNIINHQTLIATKAANICTAAEGAPVVEFGLRRAQGPDAGVYGARAAVIGGCRATSNVLAAKMFHIPPSGTMAHSFIMCFSDELTAFREYASLYPDACTLLVDTYDTLKSGVPAAIELFTELKAVRTLKSAAIRIDSGDLAYLSKKARTMLDAAGLQEVKIMASNEIDEELIASLKSQHARIDGWGVGTKLITSDNMPSLGGVYKMAAFAAENGNLEPKIKLSNTLEKITNPGFKELYRFYSLETGKALADLVALKDEALDFRDGFTIVHPTERWKKTALNGFRVRKLLVKIFGAGKRLYASPAVSDIATTRAREMETFWEEITRNQNPHIYKVDLSEGLYRLKTELIEKMQV
ncbi:nicotinate phosphoribosyltransferase [Clostridia bacterium]|nr:nicotinate phosphoribosyltransferase [Clostridia bacterium]